MTVQLDLQLASEAKNLPSTDDFKSWLDAATPNSKKVYDVTVRLVDEAEMISLNRQYRGKEKTTNVLSFPVDVPETVAEPLLGDIIICVPVVYNEAEQQNKSVLAHFAHLTIHGALHLQGYDHQKDLDAEEMESLEVEILRDLGFENPYL